MGFHREALALDKMFAGMVKMILSQFVLATAPAEPAARRNVNLYRVAVVDQSAAAFIPGHADWRQHCLDAAAYVQRGLLRTGRAGKVGLVDLTPMFRAGLAGVTPVFVVRCRDGTSAQWTGTESPESHQKIPPPHAPLSVGWRPSQPDEDHQGTVPAVLILA